MKTTYILFQILADVEMSAESSEHSPFSQGEMIRVSEVIETWKGVNRGEWDRDEYWRVEEAVRSGGGVSKSHQYVENTETLGRGLRDQELPPLTAAMYGQ